MTPEDWDDCELTPQEEAAREAYERELGWEDEPSNVVAVQTSYKGFPFTLFSRLGEAARKDWLVDGLLGAGELSAFYGEPGSGKSVLATDLAFAVATGRPWRGRALERGAVIYVAAERASVTKRRLLALGKHHGVTDAPVVVVSQSIDLLNKGDGERLAETATMVRKGSGLPVRLIIIDTVSMVLAGADENAPAVMSKAVANLRKIQEATGAHVCAIHHSPSDNPMKMRGHGALIGALDTSILVQKTSDTCRAFRVVKANDGEEGQETYFDLKGIVVHTDEQGRDTTAPIVVDAEALAPIDVRPPSERRAAAKRPAVAAPGDGLRPRTSKALAILTRLIAEEGARVTAPGVPDLAPVIREERWRAACDREELARSDKPDNRKSVFYAERRNLRGLGMISFRDGWAWLIDASDRVTNGDTETPVTACHQGQEKVTGTGDTAPLKGGLMSPRPVVTNSPVPAGDTPAAINGNARQLSTKLQGNRLTKANDRAGP